MANIEVVPVQSNEYNITLTEKEAEGLKALVLSGTSWPTAVNLGLEDLMRALISLPIDKDVHFSSFARNKPGYPRI